jgi:hypothetical protein
LFSACATPLDCFGTSNGYSFAGVLASSTFGSSLAGASDSSVFGSSSFVSSYTTGLASSLGASFSILS